VSDAPGLSTAGLTASVVLVRHGQSTWIAEGRFQGQADPPLSSLGVEQASRLAARLAGERGGDPMPAAPPQAIWSSPLGRARATADHLAAIAAWPAVQTLDGLMEIGQGEWEGQPASVVADRWPDALAGWRRDPTIHHAPGGEALPDVDVRIRASLGRVLDDLRSVTDAAGAGGPSGSPVPGYTPASADRPWAVVVAHDGVLRLALLALLDLPMGSFWRLPFVLCGVSVVTLDGGAVALRAHNLAEHLSGTAAGPAERARPGAL
jgi:probable phosphoglycerate mutase